jgi:hypothetical protein
MSSLRTAKRPAPDGRVPDPMARVRNHQRVAWGLIPLATAVATATAVVAWRGFRHGKRLAGVRTEHERDRAAVRLRNRRHPVPLDPLRHCCITGK